jgi:hypothetical protein
MLSSINYLTSVSVLLIEAGGSGFGNDKIRVPGKVSSSQLTEVDWAYYTEPEKNSHFAMKEQVIQWKTNATVRTVPFSIIAPADPAPTKINQNQC